MPSSWFVRPETVRLDLSEGQWVEIKEQLSYGEDQKLTGLLVTSVRPGDDGNVVGGNYGVYAVRKLLSWITDWSLRDADDKPVEVSLASIENLTPDAAEAINEAINAYLAKRQEGKAMSTSNGSAKR